jgi:hypothetical protein
MSADFDRELERALSYERFSRYLEWANGDRARGIQLYTLNTKLSESFYLPLQMLEVALRNRIHDVMADTYREDWLLRTGILTLEHQHGQIEDAKAELRRERKDITSGRIVAALPFSFWTSMFSPIYDTLWQQTLHRIARTPEGRGLRRKDFSTPLKTLRTLRNRIAHHEPILRWNLPKHHDNAVKLTEWLSPAAADWCRTHSRFHAMYPDEPLVLGSSASQSGDQ